MKILIVGANSLLGSELIAILSKKYHVYGTVRDKDNLKFDLNENISLLELDLYKPDLDKLPFDIDCIYYLAQSNKFRDFPNSYEDIFNINIYTPLKFVDWARKKGIKKFFYTSSGGVYKNPTQPVSEFFNINANIKNGFYLDSKLSAEILLKNFSNFFETFIIFRPFFIYGEKQNKDMLIPRLINNIIDGNYIILNGENGLRINPIYVLDAAKALANALYVTKGEYLFNIAGNEVFSLREICNVISTKINKKVLFEINYMEQSDLVADITQMKEKLIIPKVTFQLGVQKVIDSLNKK